MAVDGDQVVVAITSDDGVITGFATDEEGRFLPGAAARTGIQLLSLGGVMRFDGGWFAVGSGGLRSDEGGDEELLFDVRAFRSSDGRTWAAVEDATGLDGPADVTGLATTENGLVAVGVQRTADKPARGGFRPVAWQSVDGVRWTTVPLPTSGGTEGSVQAVSVTGNEVLAVGAIDHKGAMWSSTDGGGSWVVVERDGIPPTASLSAIATQGDVLLVSGMSSGGEDEGDRAQILLRSTDGGRRWRPAADPPPPNRGEPIGFPLFAGGGKFFTLGHSFIEAFAEPELCYADIELCRQGSTVSLYVSDDGDRWTRVDTSGLGEGDAQDIDAITATGDGRIVALTRVENGTGTWTWPAGVPLPTEAEPIDPTTDIDVLGEHDVPELGTRYGVPLYIHCSMEWLYVGGQAWQRTDHGPDIATGAGDENTDRWPVAGDTIFGFVTLVRDDLIEYSINDGSVIATYAPATEPPPGCA